MKGGAAAVGKDKGVGAAQGSVAKVVDLAQDDIGIELADPCGPLEMSE